MVSYCKIRKKKKKEIKTCERLYLKWKLIGIKINGGLSEKFQFDGD